MLNCIEVRQTDLYQVYSCRLLLYGEQILLKHEVAVAQSDHSQSKGPGLDSCTMHKLDFAGVFDDIYI